MGSWFLGVALGGLSGALLFVISLPALVLMVPWSWWAIRDRRRPLGLGGLLVGFGGGMIGLVWSASARCAASKVSGPGFVSTCEAPDYTPYLFVAAVLVLTGAGVSLLGLLRRRVAR
jgi:hypothetical protein